MPVSRPALAYALIALVAAPAAASAQQSWTQNYRGSQASNAPAYAGARRPLDGSLKDQGYPAPAPYPARRPDIWTGLYAGIDGGGGFGGLGYSGLAGDNPTAGGGYLGGHIGYNIQMGSYVAGLEVDGGWSGVDARDSYPGADITGRFNWLSSTRGRLGYAWDKWLVYATGGLALGGFEATAIGGGTSGTASDTLVGYVVGAGVEMKLSDHVSARVEALHYGFGDTTLALPQGALKVDPDVTTVRAGLTFHWN